MLNLASPAMPNDISLAKSAVKRNRLILIALWFFFYCSVTLFTPPLLDDADSVHAEVAREILLRHDWVTLYANGIRYLEKAPLLYWSIAASFKLFGIHTATARLPLAFTVLALTLILEAFARRAFSSPEPSRSSLERPESAIRAGLYAGLLLLSSFGIFIFTRILIPDAIVCLWLTLALYFYWLTEQSTEPQNRVPHDRRSLTAPIVGSFTTQPLPSNPNPLLCWAFAACCALNVLTKGPNRHSLPDPHSPRPPRTHPSRPPRRPHPHQATRPRLQHHRLPRHRHPLAHPHRPRQPHPRPSRQPILHPRSLVGPPPH